MNAATAEQAVATRPSADIYNHEIVDCARALVPLLRSNAEETEKNRSIHPQNIEALRAAGLFSLSTPRRYGGLELSLRTFIEAVAELGRGCGSTAWVTFVQNGSAFMAGHFGDRCQQDIWGGNPQAQFCGIFSANATSKRVEDGWRVSGSWPFASGCLHADWAFVSFPVTDETGTVIDDGITMVPITDFTIKDTWHVAGMRGTGSNTLVGEDFYVPEHRVVSMPQVVEGINATDHPEEALYHSTFVPYMLLIAVAPLLGMVAHGMEYIDELLAKEKPIVYTVYTSARTAPSVHHSRAAAQVAYDDAWLHARRIADAVDAAAAGHGYLDIAARVRIKMEVGYILRLLRSSMEHLLDIGGGGSFAEASPLQRDWRDLSMASRHGILNPQIAEETYGRYLVGIDDPVTRIV